ncbi:hypothetical protein L484_008808 [Morus notabilis]|uniref:Uncharacterized protein n=1 Tax=Morus notabilis TaxID=981085 RepID=W9RA42_9ROSA|nr:hypothetical protein L484_008808 [Morus notabilis]
MGQFNATISVIGRKPDSTVIIAASKNTNADDDALAKAEAISFALLLAEFYGYFPVTTIESASAKVTIEVGTLPLTT